MMFVSVLAVLMATAADVSRAEWRVSESEEKAIKSWMIKPAQRAVDTNEVVVAETPRNLKLFLLIGQSNMAGRGALSEKDRETIPHCLKLNRNNKWVEARSPIHFDRPQAGYGIADSFIRRYLEEHPTETVGLIPCAVGGSPSSTWSPEAGVSDPIGTNYRRAVARTRVAQGNGQLVGILWHQGEADADVLKTDPSHGKRYVARLSAMAESLRRELACPNVPFIIGEIGTLPHDCTAMNPILAATAAAIPTCSLVKASDLTGHLSDGVHFDTSSYNVLGERYYEAWKALSASADVVACRARAAAEPMMAVRLRGNETASVEAWHACYKDLRANTGCCNEVWLSTGCGVPSLEKHRANAAVLAEAVRELRADGIAPSLQFQATIGHGDQVGLMEDTSARAWTAWTDHKGVATRTCSCPRQPGFLKYLEATSAIYASLGFAALWIDDDLRIDNHRPADNTGNHVGCWCETCLKDFNAETKANWTRVGLSAAVDEDSELAVRWRRFSIASITRVAEVIATAFHKGSPETMMGLQQGSWDECADSVRTVLETLNRTSGRPVGYRPGGGFYYDDVTPTVMLKKSMSAAAFRARLGDPEFIRVWTPEIESWPRTYYSRSERSAAIEGFSALMYGMNSVSYFVSNTAKESGELYGRTIWRELAADSPVLTGYATLVNQSVPVGYTMPGKISLGLRNAAIPVLAGFGRSVGTLTEDEMTLHLATLSSEEVQRLRDRLDARAGKLPAKVVSPFFGLFQIHADAKGAFRAAALLNTRISRQGPVRVLIRSRVHEAGQITWHEMGKAPLTLDLKQTASCDRVVEIPSIDAWNGGYLSF